MKNLSKKNSLVLSKLSIQVLTREECKLLKGGGVIVTMDDNDTDVD